MDLTLAIWLFGACGIGIGGAFGLAWAAHGKAEKIKDELYAYKLHVAEHFASITYAAAIERRTVVALDEIKDELKYQNEKLDQLLMKGRP